MKSGLIKNLLTASVVMLLSCNKDVAPTIEPSTIQPELGDKDVVIDITTKYQKIESFMASDAWMPNIVGTYWAEDTKAAIAKLLFSKELENGNPKGIGLSGWRFLLGGGSFNQGSASDIELVDRRSESFMDPVTGSIDWNKQKGQIYFLNKAKEYGVDQFVMFSNSPPVSMTKNGKAYSASGESSNLKDDRYPDFANYITTTISHIRDVHGVNFNFVSPFNEPQYNWDSPSQEGTGWRNSESFRLMKELDLSLQQKNLSTKIMFGESAAYNYLYEIGNKPGRANVLNDFFKTGGQYNLMELPSVAKIVAAHSYWNDGDWNTLTNTRNRVSEEVAAAGVKLYQTEWSMLGDHFSTSEFVGFDKATYMDIAIYLSKIIYADLALANAASWSYWTSMDVERWDHKNRFYLIRLKPTAGDYGNVLAGGTYEATKTLWVLGNYSLFIRPGYTRVKVDVKGQNESLFGAGFVSPDSKTLVVVYTNKSNQLKQLKVEHPAGTVKSIKSYTTSETTNLKEQIFTDKKASIQLPAKSVVTVKYEFE